MLKTEAMVVTTQSFQSSGRGESAETNSVGIKVYLNWPRKKANS